MEIIKSWFGPALIAGVLAAAPAFADDPGEHLFEEETFGGNGRTCRTCHTEKSGALSPADVAAAYRRNRQGPLFRAIDSDDRAGQSYARLINTATVLVDISLPQGWSIPGSSQTHATLARAVPTTMNVPALDPLLMADGRFSTPESQALGAVHAHAEPTREPSAGELAAIAQFEKSSDFFSADALKSYAAGGAAPTLPAGRTAAEKRGRRWFVPSAQGVCGHCHAGPMLNQTSSFFVPPPGVTMPVGSRFWTAFVSEFNRAGLPLQTFAVQTPGGVTQVASPDPGRALITGQLSDVNLFRIPTLWGVKGTAPYFHDNSAATLEALVQHYSDYFAIVGVGAIAPAAQADIVAYLKLL
ncbi:MAG: hypothetical protein RL385_3738 [Pseudomonadota bacterium]|jgi:cytochrome c peroxidase